MAVIKWDDSYSVNIALIDNQHKKLIDMINQLSEAMLQGKSKDILGTILDKMTHYATVHFTTEEKYFEKFAYKGADVHNMQHSEFIKRVKEFRTSYNDGAALLSMDIIDFLRNWLKHHIQVSDKKYSKFLNENGVT